MTGHEYEKFVASHISVYGFHGVKITKGSGDFGADLIAWKNGKKYAIQCKYYSNPVGNSAVQEVVAAKAYYGCQKAAVITNNRFTSAAKTLANSNGVVLYPNFSPSTVNINYVWTLWVISCLIVAFTLWILPDVLSPIYPIGALIVSILIKNRKRWKIPHRKEKVANNLPQPIVEYDDVDIPKNVSTNTTISSEENMPIEDELSNEEFKRLIDNNIKFFVGDNPDFDLYLSDAICIVYENGVATASLLQRKLKLGYSRAMRMLDIMENCGIIDVIVNKPRPVLIGKNELIEKLKEYELKNKENGE